MFEREVRHTAYAIRLTLKDFTLVVNADKYMLEQDTLDLCLSHRLEKLGCIEVDYDGHFGTYIYFSLIPENDTERMWMEIYKEIQCAIDYGAM